MIWQTKLTPIHGLVEVATVKADELDLDYDIATGVIRAAPHVVAFHNPTFHNPTRGLAIPEPTKLAAEIVRFFELSGLGLSIKDEISERAAQWHVHRHARGRLKLIASHGNACGTQYTENARPPYEIAFQVLPWRLYWVPWQILHRAPPELISDGPCRPTRLSYRWSFSPSIANKVLGLDNLRDGLRDE